MLFFTKTENFIFTFNITRMISKVLVATVFRERDKRRVNEIIHYIQTERAIS